MLDLCLSGCSFGSVFGVMPFEDCGSGCFSDAAEIRLLFKSHGISFNLFKSTIQSGLHITVSTHLILAGNYHFGAKHKAMGFDVNLNEPCLIMSTV